MCESVVSGGREGIWFVDVSRSRLDGNPMPLFLESHKIQRIGKGQSVPQLRGIPERTLPTHVHVQPHDLHTVCHGVRGQGSASKWISMHVHTFQAKAAMTHRDTHKFIRV